MKRIIAYKTCDDALHETQEAAKHHAFKRYNEAINNLRMALQADCKLHPQDAGRVIEFLEYHIESILPELLDLKHDQRLIEQCIEDYQDIDED